LQNSACFFLSWKRDPTVQSMLRRLDAVHEKFEKFKDEEIDGFWKILTAEHYTLPTDNPKLNELVQLIETKGNEETQEKLKEIQEKPAISFKFLNLDEFELADDLYLKMNARGKALTDFENLKAKIEQHIIEKEWEKDVESEQTFSFKMDTIWTDLFWRHKGNSSAIDYEAINFIAGIVMITYAQNGSKYNAET